MSRSIGNSNRAKAWAEEIVRFHSLSPPAERARGSRGLNKDSGLFEYGEPQHGIPKETSDAEVPGGLALARREPSHVIQRAVTRGQGRVNPVSEINVEEVANKVYRLMQHDLIIERERSVK